MKKIDRAQPAVEIQTLAQVELRRHLAAIGPPHAGQPHRAEQDGIEFAQSLEYGRGQRVAAAQIFSRPDGKLLIRQNRSNAARVNRIQNADGLLHHFRADSIPRKQGNSERLHAPVTSLHFAKNWRLRPVLIPQFTGRHWYRSE